MMKMARSEEGIAINSDGLDADPWELNCENGVLNLKTGELRAHDPADLITKLCPVKFDPDADCKLWLRTLDRCMAGDKDRVRFLRRAAGMSASGSIEDHVLLVCYGVGENGKSKILGAIRDVLGPDYAMSAPPNLLMAKGGHDRHPTEQADLRGRRFVSCIETADGCD